MAGPTPTAAPIVGRPAGVKRGLVLEKTHIWSVTQSNSWHARFGLRPVRDREVGPALLTTPQARTHHQGWPVAKLSARNSASVRCAIRSSIWGRLHRAKNRADRHALTGHVFSMRMLSNEGFRCYMPCSIPGRNRIDQIFCSIAW